MSPLLFIAINSFALSYAFQNPVRKSLGSVINTKNLVSATILATLSQEEKVSVGHGWLPVIPMDSCNPDHPHQIEIAGFKYVVWKNPLEKDPKKAWNVIRDACTHRFAPMSEGRIDAKSGCIECPYHGWQYESGTGLCTSIPQDPANPMLRKAETSLPSYLTHSTNNLLWAYLPIPGTNITYDKLPEEYIPEYNQGPRSIAIRDLPYSFDFAMENLLDPAHVPFAHHRLQGSRDDATKVTIEILSKEEDPTSFEIAFSDRTRTKYRHGTEHFSFPAHFYFKDNTTKDGSLQTKLVISAVPISPGRTRFFTNVNTPTKGIPGLIFKLFPTWFLHAFSMNFLDSDAWVGDAEVFIRLAHNSFSLLQKEDENVKMKEDSLLGSRVEDTPRYAVVTNADRSVIGWRRWWKRHMSSIPAYGAQVSNLPKLTDLQKRDRYTDHAVYCQHCQKALLQARSLDTLWAPIAALSIIALSKSTLGRLLGVGVYFLLKKISVFITKTVLGKERWEPMGTARLP